MSQHFTHLSFTANKRSLFSSLCLSNSICSFYHCYLCLPRLHENHLLTLLLSLLYKTPVAMRFPAKITSSCIGLPYLLIELFFIGMPVVRTDGLSGGRSVGRCTVTWLPNFLGWVDYFIFLLMVLRWHASCARALLKSSRPFFKDLSFLIHLTTRSSTLKPFPLLRKNCRLNYWVNMKTAHKSFLLRLFAIFSSIDVKQL